MPLLPRGEATDSPLSITANIVGILTLVFAIAISIQVYILSFHHAYRDRWALKSSHSTSLSLARDIASKLELYSKLNNDLICAGEESFPYLLEARAQEARLELKSLVEKAEKLDALFDGDAAMKFVEARRKGERPVRATLEYLWASWRKRVEFVAEEGELKRAFVGLHTQTEQARWVVVEMEIFLSTTSKGRQVLGETPKTNLTPFGSIVLDLETVKKQNEELKLMLNDQFADLKTAKVQNAELAQNLNLLVNLLQHHLQRDVVPIRDDRTSEDTRQAQALESRPRRPTM